MLLQQEAVIIILPEKREIAGSLLIPVTSSSGIVESPVNSMPPLSISVAITKISTKRGAYNYLFKPRFFQKPKPGVCKETEYSYH